MILMSLLFPNNSRHDDELASINYHTRHEIIKINIRFVKL